MDIYTFTHISRLSIYELPMSVRETVVRQYEALVNRAADLIGQQPLPKEGWIATARKALGMSAAQLGVRLGVTRARISQAERAELGGGVTLKTMHAAAEAMGCRFVYAIVPARGHVNDLIAAQARKKAELLVGRASAHMALELQSLSEQTNRAEIERTVTELVRTRPADSLGGQVIGEGYPEDATPLDPDDIAGLKHPHVTTRSQLDELEQANIQSGLIWLTRRRRKTDVLTERFMLDLHRHLFGDVWSWAGQFRRTEKNIGIDPRNISVQFRMLLDDARYWAEHKVFQPLEAGARFHHRIVQIYPFSNGNGRHGRIAADTYLESCFQHPPIDWAAGHDLQRNTDRRTTYIAALRAADAGSFSQLFHVVGVPAVE